jgi:hypothetical protein
MHRDRTLTPQETDELSAHLRSCLQCTAIARSDRLTRLLLGVLTADEQLSPYFLARLRARLREAQPPAWDSRWWVKALLPAVASLTLILAGIVYLLSPPPPSPIFLFLDSRAVASETYALLGIPQPTHDQILASVLEAEERAP